MIHCYRPFHFNNGSDSGPLGLDFMVTKNKQGIVLNRIWLISGPTQCILLAGFYKVIFRDHVRKGMDYVQHVRLLEILKSILEGILWATSHTRLKARNYCIIRSPTGRKRPRPSLQVHFTLKVEA
jgi:hypothetical protein